MACPQTTVAISAAKNGYTLDYEIPHCPRFQVSYVTIVYTSSLVTMKQIRSTLVSIIHISQFAISQINLQFPKLISSYFTLLGHLFKSLALVWLCFLNLQDYCWFLNKFVSVAFFPSYLVDLNCSSVS